MGAGIIIGYGNPCPLLIVIRLICSVELCFQFDVDYVSIVFPQLELQTPFGYYWLQYLVLNLSESQTLLYSTSNSSLVLYQLELQTLPGCHLYKVVAPIRVTSSFWIQLVIATGFASRWSQQLPLCVSCIKLLHQSELQTPLGHNWLRFSGIVSTCMRLLHQSELQTLFEYNWLKLQVLHPGGVTHSLWVTPVWSYCSNLSYKLLLDTSG